MRKDMILAGAILAGLTAASVQPGFANDKSSDAAEIKALDSAKLTAADAATAVAKNGERVMAVDFTVREGKPVYHVEAFASGGEPRTFAVDAGTGEITPIASNQDEGNENDDDGQD